MWSVANQLHGHVIRLCISGGGGLEAQSSEEEEERIVSSRL